MPGVEERDLWPKGVRKKDARFGPEEPQNKDPQLPTFDEGPRDDPGHTVHVGDHHRKIRSGNEPREGRSKVRVVISENLAVVPDLLHPPEGLLGGQDIGETVEIFPGVAGVEDEISTTQKRLERSETFQRSMEVISEGDGQLPGAPWKGDADEDR
jgi:hypothetical protein